MKLYQGTIAVVVSFVVTGVAMFALGADLRSSALLAGALTVQAAAGAYWWLRVRLSRDPAASMHITELIGMGVALGTALSMMSGVMFGVVGLHRFGWLLPVGGALLDMGRRRIRGDSARVRLSFGIPALVAMIAGVLVGLLALKQGMGRYPLSWVGESGLYHRDMVFFEALSKSIANFGPGESVLLSGSGVRYHWFAYAWSGQMAETLNIPAFVTLTRALPLVALVGLVTLAAAWSSARSRRTWVPTLAALLLVAGGYVGAENGSALNIDSPSQSLSAVWLLAFTIAYLKYLDMPRGWAMPAVCTILMASMVGGKFSSGIVAMVALTVVSVGSSFRSSPWQRPSWLVTGLSAGALAVTFVLVLQGSSSAGAYQLFTLENKASFAQGLDPSPGAWGAAVGTLGLALAMGARWSGSIWPLGSRSTRWLPESLLALGFILAGIVPLILLSHPVNETWFALAASAPLSVLAAIGVGVAWQHLQARRVKILVISIAVVSVGLAGVLWAMGSPGTQSVRFAAPLVPWILGMVAGAAAMVLGRPQRRTESFFAAVVVMLTLTSLGGRVIVNMPGLGSHGVTEPAPNGGADPPEARVNPESIGDPEWSSLDVEAARFLGGISDPGDVVVTNNISSPVVAALTGLRTFVSSAPEQIGLGDAASAGLVRSRAETAIRFTTVPSDQLGSVLCASEVRWVWVDKDVSTLPDWMGTALTVFENDSVGIARLANC
jgi:hypothetical protein